MSTKDDRAKAFREWEVKMHRRIVRNLWRIVDMEAARIVAARAVRQRRRWQEPQTPEINPVDKFRREVVPIMAEMAELAGGDREMFMKLAKPKRLRAK